MGCISSGSKVVSPTKTGAGAVPVKEVVVVDAAEGTSALVRQVTHSHCADLNHDHEKFNCCVAECEAHEAKNPNWKADESSKIASILENAEAASKNASLVMEKTKSQLAEHKAAEPAAEVEAEAKPEEVPAATEEVAAAAEE